MLVVTEVTAMVVMVVPAFIVVFAVIGDAGSFARRGDGNPGSSAECAAEHGAVAPTDGRTDCCTCTSAQGAAQYRIGGNIACISLAYGDGEQDA